MKSKLGIAIVMGFMFGAAFAEDKPKPVPPTPPAVSSTEKLAANALAQKIADLEGQLTQFETEFTSAHPGWQMNVRTGQLVPIQQPEPKLSPKPVAK